MIIAIFHKLEEIFPFIDETCLF